MTTLHARMLSEPHIHSHVDCPHLVSSGLTWQAGLLHLAGSFTLPRSFHDISSWPHCVHWNSARLWSGMTPLVRVTCRSGRRGSVDGARWVGGGWGGGDR